MYDGVLRDGLGLGLEKREARKVAEALEERRERVRGKEREREEVFGCLFSWEDNEREKWKKKKNKKKKTVFLQRAIAECREEERERVKGVFGLGYSGGCEVGWIFIPSAREAK